MTYLVFRYLHLASVAIWLAAAAGVAGALWRDPEPGEVQSGQLAARVRTCLRRDLFAGVAALATGLILASPVGGLGPPRKGVLVGLGLTVLLLGLIGFVSIPQWRRTALHIESEGTQEDLLTSIQWQRRFIIASHLLWLVALGTMVYPA